jgi:hypothetical protein
MTNDPFMAGGDRPFGGAFDIRQLTFFFRVALLARLFRTVRVYPHHA